MNLIVLVILVGIAFTFFPNIPQKIQNLAYFMLVVLVFLWALQLTGFVDSGFTTYRFSK